MTVLDIRSRADNKVRGSSTAGNGGRAGILLSLDMVPTSYYAVAYTVPVQVGSSQQNLSLQVDTGSSDLWIASKSCSSASCAATNGRLYDPSSSQSAGESFTIQYLSGSVSGPIVWDQVRIGGYLIPNQPLAAATTVNEPLSYNFDGVLGLALPLDSVIQQTVPVNTDNGPDGAAFSSNLFALTDAPSQPFFSLCLGRPGFTQIPSLLGIGLHPSNLVPDPSQIRYSPLVNDGPGLLFWKTTVRAITVYVHGQAYPIALASLSGASAPTALLDSGTPVILVTPTLANGIYGALGIGPAPDGNYYVPCTTPLNMTITLDGQDALPMHPLDLTMAPAGAGAAMCTGLIQTDASKLTASSDAGDMVLGVPFLRSVYTVLAYGGPPNATTGTVTYPALGLLGLTNATQAMAEFDQVRVLGGGSSSSSSSPSDAGGPRFSTGVKVLIGLAGAFVVCVALFVVRYAVARRRLSVRRHAADAPHAAVEKDAEALERTREHEHDDAREFGVRRARRGYPLVDESDPWDPYAGTWRDTIVGTDAPASSKCSCDDHGHDADDTTMTAAAATTAMDEFGMRMGMGMGMAGIGTAARGSLIDADLQADYRPLSYDSTASRRTTANAVRTPSSPPRESDPLVLDTDRTL